MKTQIKNEKDLVGKEVLKYNSFGSQLVIHFKDNSFALFSEYVDTGIHLDNEDYWSNLEHTYALQLDIITKEEYQEIERKEKEEYEKLEQEREYQNYLRLKAIYEKEI